MSNYNTSRNLTKSTFDVIKYYLQNNFMSVYPHEHKLIFVIETPTYYVLDDIKSFIRSVWIKIILRIEKLIGNTSGLIYPIGTQDEINSYNKNSSDLDQNWTWTCKYEFRFNGFNPNSSNIFLDLKNKITSLYEDSNVFYFIENTDVEIKK